MSEGGQWRGHANRWGHSLKTDKLVLAILVTQQHILLLKYRRGELRFGGIGARF